MLNLESELMESLNFDDAVKPVDFNIYLKKISVSTISKIEEIVSLINDLITEEIVINKNLLDIKIDLGKYLSYLKGHYYQMNLEEILKETNISYSKSESYFCISLYNLTEEYPKFKNVTLSVRKIRTNMKLIKEILKENKAFWSCAQD